MSGHAIPEPYVWDESFKMFYEQLDKEYQGLLDGIFALAKDNNAANLQSLKDKVVAHLKYEESQMDNAKYSEVAGHKQLHVDFVAKLGGLSAPVGADGLQFAKEWLVNHIKDTDFKYKGKL